MRWIFYHVENYHARGLVTWILDIIGEEMG
jgi:hypothetical protein